MNIIVLSYFDHIFGPKIFMKTPKSFDDEEINQIPVLIDMYEEGFFIHIFGGFKSANYFFEINSPIARGGTERLLLSILTTEGELNQELLKELLERFINEIQQIPDIYSAFYSTKNSENKAQAKYTQLDNLMNTFYEHLPKDVAIIKRRKAKIFIFGPSKAGKTTIINCLRNEFDKTTLPTTSMSISKLLIGSLEFLTYDVPGQTKFQKLWLPYLKNQDGLVFVFDITDKERYEEAKEMLHRVVTMPQTKNLPLLILFNKVDLGTPDVLSIEKAVGIPELGKRHFKCFLTSGLINEGVAEAFDWFAETIVNRLMPSRFTEVNCIFAKWDEDEGPQIISEYPAHSFEDAENVAIESFSLSQFVFGGKEFKKTSFIMPFVHLNSRASMLFDYIPDENVRGGRLPLLLAIFFNNTIPMPIIEQFNVFIFEKFSLIKNNWSHIQIVEENLEEIRNEIIEKLKKIKPTVHAIRVAERRYESLFKTARDGIIIIDRRLGIIVDANEQAEMMLKSTKEDLIGANISQIQSADENIGLMDRIQEQLNTLNSPPFIYWIKDIDLKFIPVEINASQIQIGGQHLIQCTFRDITNRLKAEEALKASEERHRRIVELNPFPIIIFSKGNVEYVNPMFIELFGYSLEDIPTGREWSRKAYPNPEYRHKVIAAFKNYEEHPYDPNLGIDPYTFDVTCKDGTIRRIIFNPVYIDKDKQFFICEDITERITAQKAQKESEEKHRRIVELNPFPIIIFSKGNIEYVNPKFIELFGYSLENISTGREWSRKAYPDPEYRHKVIAAFKNYEENPYDPSLGVDPYTFKVTCKNGSIRKIIFNPVNIDKDKQFFICEDITERMKSI